MGLRVGGVDLIRSVGVRGLHGNWGGREGSSGSGREATCAGHVATLAVAVHSQWGIGGNCLVHRTRIVNGIGDHWVGTLFVGI